MENKDNNIVVNAKPNTIVLQSTEEEVTGGYYDGEGTYHEFGGGGESSLQPILTLTIVNSAESSEAIEGIGNSEDCSFIKGVNITDISQMYYFDPVIPIGGSGTIQCIVYEDGYALLFISGYSQKTYTYTDLVNCTANTSEGDIYVEITDMTKEASVTVTVKVGA